MHRIDEQYSKAAKTGRGNEPEKKRQKGKKERQKERHNSLCLWFFSSLMCFCVSSPSPRLPFQVQEMASRRSQAKSNSQRKKAQRKARKKQEAASKSNRTRRIATETDRGREALSFVFEVTSTVETDRKIR